jgi:hypothetical protein
MAQAKSALTRRLAWLYILTAVSCMALACMDVSDIYRVDVHLLSMLRPPPWRSWYLWTELVFNGVSLIAPEAALLFCGVGISSSSESRVRAFGISMGFVLPCITITCLPHLHGGRAALYVAGPIASILASLAYKRVAYEKCAFWSSAVLLGSRLFIVYSRMNDVYTPIVGSYMRWAEIEFTGAGLALLCALLSVIRLAYSARVSRLARKTFTA